MMHNQSKIALVGEGASHGGYGSSPVPSTINQGQNFLTFGVLESGTVKRAS